MISAAARAGSPVRGSVSMANGGEGVAGLAGAGTAAGGAAGAGVSWARAAGTAAAARASAETRTKDVAARCGVTMVTYSGVGAAPASSPTVNVAVVVASACPISSRRQTATFLGPVFMRSW